MNHNVILLAASRGARILHEHGDSPVGCLCHGMRYRIHPEDDHLRLGVISTALREKSKDPSPGEFGDDLLPYLDAAPYIPECEYWDWLESKELKRSLFLLIMSEALASEGL